MGLLDLPAPLFGLLDQALAFLPAAMRLALWALLSAAVSMWLYKLCSRQERLAELKPQIKATQRDMARYDGPLEGLWPLIGKSMRLSGSQMGLTLWPALAASLPVLFVLVFLSNSYSVELPAAGESVTVTVTHTDSQVHWTWRGAPEAARLSEQFGWRLPWPTNEATLLAPGHGAVLTLPLATPASVIHKRQWWNWLIGNPAGYLADDVPAKAIHIALHEQHFLSFGPSWMRGWEFIYLVLLMVFSLAIKIYWKIH